MKELEQISEIKKLISEDKIKEAFSEFKSIANGSDINNAILLEGRFNNLVNEWNRGTIPNQESFLEKNRIRAAFLNFLEDYEIEWIRNINETNDDTASLVKLMYAKTSIDNNLINYLIQIRTTNNRIELETIKRLILYEYKVSGTDNYIKKTLKLRGDEKLKLSRIVSFGLHSITFEATDSKDKSYVLKVLHPKFYDHGASTFKERHDKQKKLSQEGNNIVEILDVVNKAKNEIILAIVEKYDSDLRQFVLNDKNKNSYYETIKHIFIDICNATRFLHEKGVAHRDIVPSNILLKNTQKGYLGDFDNVFIKDSEETEEDFRHRSTNEDDIFFDVFIEPDYISRLNNRNKFSCSFEEAKEIDLYSLCVTLLFCLLKTRFSNNIELINFLKEKSKGDDNKMKLYAIDILDFGDYSIKINTRVKIFLEKGLNKNKSERFKSINDLIANFDGIKDDLAPIIQPRVATNKIWYVKYSSLFFIFGITFLSLLLYNNKCNELNKIKSWVELDNKSFFTEKELSIISSYLDTSIYFQNLIIDSSQQNTLSNYTNIVGASSSIGNNTKAEAGPLIGAVYNKASFQAIKRNYDISKEAKIFEDITNKIINSGTKHFDKSTYYANLDNTLNFPATLEKKVQTILFFIYYKNKNSDSYFYRYPKTDLTPKQESDFDPIKRPWYEEIMQPQRGYIIDKGKKGISVPYFAWSSSSRHVVITIYKRIINNDSEIIFGIDILPKD